jgi:HSP20 family protein
MNAATKPRWSVFLPQPFDSVKDEMDQVFENLLGGSTSNGHRQSGPLFAPASLWEEEGRWCADVDLPGVRPEDLDITVEKNVLRLVAERKDPQQERKVWHQERRYGRIERLITLPETVDPEGISAELKDGVLSLTLIKKPESQPRKITIKVD